MATVGDSAADVNLYADSTIIKNGSKYPDLIKLYASKSLTKVITSVECIQNVSLWDKLFNKNISPLKFKGTDDKLHTTYVKKDQNAVASLCFLNPENMNLITLEKLPKCTNYLPIKKRSAKRLQQKDSVLSDLFKNTQKIKKNLERTCRLTQTVATCVVGDNRDIKGRLIVECSKNGMGSSLQLGKIGEGSFKQITLGLDLKHKKKIAYGITDLRPQVNEEGEVINIPAQTAIKEYYAIDEIYKSNIKRNCKPIPGILPIYFIDWKYIDGNPYQILGMKNCNSKDLLHVIHNRGTPLLNGLDAVLTPDYVMDICLDIGNGLEYLHSINIIHRDIKPENIILHLKKNKTLQNYNTLLAFLADFGFTTNLNNIDLNEFPGSASYLAPELVRCMMDETPPEFSKASDIYAWGVTFFALFTGLMTRPSTELNKAMTNYQNTRDNKLFTRKLEDILDFMRYPEYFKIRNKPLNVPIFSLIFSQLTAFDPNNRYTATDFVRQIEANRSILKMEYTIIQDTLREFLVNKYI